MPLQFSEPVDGKYHGEAVVLSGKTLRTKKHGQFTIDLPTLLYHKERLTVDYNHDSDQILGYAENFRISDDGVSLLADVYLMENIPKVQEIITLMSILEGLVKAETTINPTLNSNIDMSAETSDTHITYNQPVYITIDKLVIADKEIAERIVDALVCHQQPLLVPSNS